MAVKSTIERLLDRVSIIRDACDSTSSSSFPAIRAR